MTNNALFRKKNNVLFLLIKLVETTQILNTQRQSDPQTTFPGRQNDSTTWSNGSGVTLPVKHSQIPHKSKNKHDQLNPMPNKYQTSATQQPNAAKGNLEITTFLEIVHLSRYF